MYVIYHASTTKYARKANGDAAIYETEAAAKAARTRNAWDPKKWLIASSEDFEKIEKTEIVISLMSGKEVVQSVNTPRCCDPSTELYWSM